MQNIGCETLEMISDVCRVCGNTADNEEHTVRETVLGLDEIFTYVECSKCGCLQIRDLPKDMDRYDRIRRSCTRPYRIRDRGVHALKRRQRSKYYLTGQGAIGKLLARKTQPERFEWFRKAGISFDSKILDAGCKYGRLLIRMQREGFIDVHGIDWRLPDDIVYETGLTIRKAALVDLDETFDFIMLHHSFEHLPDPANAMQQLERLTRPGSMVLIRMPVVGSHAWRTYKTDWVQLNAPRHVCLHSRDSMNMLVEKSSFELVETVYDSTELQFFGSEQCRHGIPFEGEGSWSTDRKRSMFQTSIIEDFRDRAEELNRDGDGDQACFYLRRR